MRFEFATATRILFGEGSVREAAPAAREMGRRAFLVAGASPGCHCTISNQLRSNGVSVTPFTVGGEPEIDLVQQGIELARDERCDLVISLGGGSAIDAGKAVAALLTNEGALIDYLEVIGGARPIEKAAAPFIAIPTTAGTGSEVTRNAVLASPEHGVKASLRSPLILPRLAIVDPELTYGLPPELTACTGMDALTQVIEPFVSVRSNAMTDVFCLEGMRRVARSLLRAVHGRQRCGGQSRHGSCKLDGGTRPCQCRSWRCPRMCGPHWRNVPGTAWRRLRHTARAGDGSEHPRAPQTRNG